MLNNKYLIWRWGIIGNMITIIINFQIDMTIFASKIYSYCTRKIRRTI